MLKKGNFIYIFSFESWKLQDYLQIYSVNYGRLFKEYYFIVRFKYALLGLPVPKIEKWCSTNIFLYV